MPIYEYQCGACGHRLDHLQKLSEPDPVDCPACAAPELARRVSAPAFRLAGSGWYETDFKGDKDRRRNLAKDDAPPNVTAPEEGRKTEPAAPSTSSEPAAKAEGASG